MNQLLVRLPYRRISIPLERKVDEKILELESCDIIEQVRKLSKWISCLVPIPTANGELRLYEMREYSYFKRKSPPFLYRSPFAEKQKRKGLQYTRSKNPFHQMGLHSNSKYIKTFISFKGLYQYKRFMFGIICQRFQKFLEKMIIHCEFHRPYPRIWRKTRST